MRARRVEDIFNAADAQPGDFDLVRDRTGAYRSMGFRCPACATVAALTLHRVGEPAPGDRGPVWQWNGGEDRPTLTPSVIHAGTCGWHGWLREGQWESV